MKSFLIAAFAITTLVVCGCENGKMHMPWEKKATTQPATTQPAMMSAHDDCPMCEGVQTADKNGYCPKCGMKVKG